MYYELGNLIYGFFIIYPAVSERITNKAAVDGYLYIRVYSVIR